MYVLLNYINHDRDNDRHVCLFVDRKVKIKCMLFMAKERIQGNSYKTLRKNLYIYQKFIYDFT